MIPNNENKDSDKGFAGLSSLVSDVDGAILEARNGAKPTSEEDESAKDTTPSSNHTDDHKTDRQTTHQQPSPQPSSEPTASIWFIGIAAVLGAVLLYAVGSIEPQETKPDLAGTSSAPSKPTIYPTAPSTPITNNTQDETGAVVMVPRSNMTVESTAARATEPTPSRPDVPRRPIEVMPPVGTYHVLDTVQIRYCLSESIRIEAARTAVNNHIESDVDQFNAMTADYNSRCGQFRYRRGSIESAKSDIEPYRSVLEAEGRRRFAR